MAMLEIRNLEVYYGMIQAIKGISFDVKEGEVRSEEHMSELQSQR